MPDYQVHQINAFDDNYIWAIVKDNKCAIVDPGDSKPVLEFLQTHNFQLTDILVTHHHNDHIGGIDSLIQKFTGVDVFGPQSQRFPMVTSPCVEADKITLQNGVKLKVFELHGHTSDHIGYFDAHNAFVADTLFSAGCGRLFEGTAAQMFEAHKKIVALGDHIQIYCAHEYTLTNIEFALAAEPDNSELIEYQKHVQNLRSVNKASIPTSVKLQLAINPFLRCNQKTIQQNVVKHFDLKVHTLSDLECFTYLRRWKDIF